MTTEDIIRKVTSRKFWLCTAAFLGSVATSVAGIAADAARLKSGGEHDGD